MMYFIVTLFELLQEVCEHRNATKQCNFQNNYDVMAYSKVCSCASIFNFFCGPQNFPLGENL